ncbi:MAG: hypothetical protein JKY37_07680 [Nannocystaceae bacterium]|nr:hypothetical protein [Nannocystaceae bacterium]
MSPREFLRVIGATVRVLKDSNRLKDIHVVADITSRERFAAALRTEHARGNGELLDRKPEINKSTVDFEALGRLPADTLGGAFVRHLERHRLDIFVDPTSDEFVHDADVRYLIHRYRQTHDIWHVLMGLGVEGHEEVLVHAFTLGLLGLPVSAMIVVFGGIKHIVLERRWTTLRHGVAEAFRSGRRAKPLLTVEWEHLWDRPLDDVRRLHGIAPCTPAYVTRPEA